MQYSDTTNNSGMIQRAERYSLLGIGGITTNTNLFKEFNALFNEANNYITVQLLKSDKYWRFDDSNFGDFPIATITLISGQRDYTLPASTVSGHPSSLYRVNRVRVKDTTGNWQTIDVLDPADDESVESGMPTKYRLIGNSIRLSDIPVTGSVTLTNGMEVQFQRSPDQFTTADTTQQPAFIDAFHYLIPLYASAEFLRGTNPSLSLQYRSSRENAPGMFENGLRELLAANASRNDDSPRRLTPHYEDNR